MKVFVAGTTGAIDRSLLVGTGLGDTGKRNAVRAA